MHKYLSNIAKLLNVRVDDLITMMSRAKQQEDLQLTDTSESEIQEEVEQLCIENNNMGEDKQNKAFDLVLNRTEDLLDKVRPDDAYPYIEWLERKASSDANMGDALMLSVRFYIDRSCYPLAIDRIQEALDLPGLSSQTLSRLEMNYAEANLNQGPIRDALKRAETVLNMGEEAHPKALIFANNTFARAKVELEQLKRNKEKMDISVLKEALDYHQKAKELAKLEGYDMLVMLTEAYIGRVEAKIASTLIEEAEEGGQKEAQKYLENARKRLERAIKWGLANNDWQVVGEARWYLGELCLLENNNEELRMHCKEINDIGKIENDPRLIHVALNLEILDLYSMIKSGGAKYIALSEITPLISRSKKMIHESKISSRSPIVKEFYLVAEQIDQEISQAKKGLSLPNAASMMAIVLFFFASLMLGFNGEYKETQNLPSTTIASKSCIVVPAAKPRIEVPISSVLASKSCIERLESTKQT